MRVSLSEKMMIFRELSDVLNIKMSEFKPDCRGIGGRQVATNHMVNHMIALKNVKSTLNIKPPLARKVVSKKMAQQGSRAVRREFSNVYLVVPKKITIGDM